MRGDGLTSNVNCEKKGWKQRDITGHVSGISGWKGRIADKNVWRGGGAMGRERGGKRKSVHVFSRGGMMEGRISEKTLTTTWVL